MSTVVLDASIALAIIRDEPSAPVVRSALGSWLRRGDRLVVPAHFWLEIVNALRTRHRMNGAAIVGAIHHLDTFDLETAELDRPHLLLVVDAMERHGLSAYDAGYLVLAEAFDASLATLDRRLAVAAGGRWVPVDRPHGVHEVPVAYASEPTWPDYSGLGSFLARLRGDAQASRAKPLRAVRHWRSGDTPVR